MAKRRERSNLTEEQLERIRVKPEDTAKRLASLPYTITDRPDEKPPKGMMWCPYDSKWSSFAPHHPISPLSTYHRCETCGISMEDYYIKQTNGLWGDKAERQE